MTRLIAVVVLAACSSRSPAPTRPAPDPPVPDGPPTASGSATVTDAMPAPAKVTEADCLAMVDQMIAIDIKERPPDQQLSAEQIAQVRAELLAEYGAACLQLPPDQVACARAATTKAGLQACARSGAAE